MHTTQEFFEEEDMEAEIARREYANSEIFNADVFRDKARAEEEFRRTLRTPLLGSLRK